MIAFLAILGAGLYAADLNQSLHNRTIRDRVQSEAMLIRSRLESGVQSDVQLVRGLVATFRTEPFMSSHRFETLAAAIFHERSRLHSIAAAPGMVISYVYPMAGNKAAIGLNYLTTPDQRDATVKARDTGQLVLAGPVDLKQGGKGFIARFPVFTPTAGGEDRFWGIVSAVLEIEPLYRDSGLLDPALDIDVVIKGRDVSGDSGPVFFGDESILARDPVTVDVNLPSGIWRLSAVPKAGWETQPANAPYLYALLALALLLVTLPMLYVGRLIGDRQQGDAEVAQRNRELAELSHRLQLALEASNIGVWEYNTQSGDLVWDERVAQLYGRPQQGTQRREYHEWTDCVHPDDVERAMRESDDAVALCSTYSSSYRVIWPDGSIHHLRTKARPVQDESGLKLIGTEWDVTDDVRLHEDLNRARMVAELRNVELEAAKDRIEHNALHDALTGLPNRRYLDRELAAMRQKEASEDIALLHIDLDRFKQINDTLGHAAGDAMLVHASQVLKASARSTDFIARVGGDEFVILCPSAASMGELVMLADRIIAAMRQPVPYEGHQCRFGVSIGIAQQRADDPEAQNLMINADIALYRAKARGRGRCEFFTVALQAEIVHTKQLADEILSGLERNEFVAYYQPQFDVRSMAIVGVEALVRWNHPERGLLEPGDFLRIAEELSVVSRLDRLILEQAQRDMARWEAAGVVIPRVSVNVSARRIQDGELLAGLRQLDFKQGTLAFELVESIFLDGHDDLIEWNVLQLKQLGIEIEIDDFGTGYASIVSLQKLKPKRLKIDRQLIAPVVKSPAQRKLIESIIEIGRVLDIEIVAEGVETIEHAMMLRSIGCDYLQGFALARPMPADEIVAFARDICGAALLRQN